MLNLKRAGFLFGGLCILLVGYDLIHGPLWYPLMVSMWTLVGTAVLVAGPWYVARLLCRAEELLNADPDFSVAWYFAFAALAWLLAMLIAIVAGTFLCLYVPWYKDFIFRIDSNWDATWRSDFKLRGFFLLYGAIVGLAGYFKRIWDEVDSHPKRHVLYRPRH